MQDEAEPAAVPGRKGKPACGREIGLLAAKLGHDHVDGAAFERFLHGPQTIAWTGDPQDDEALHRQAHEIEPRSVKGARLGNGEIGLDPDRVPAAPQRQAGQRHGKTKCGAALQRRRRPDLMQGAASEAARQRLIKGWNAETDETAAFTRQIGHEVRNGTSQRMQGFGGFGGHRFARRVSVGGRSCFVL